MDGVTRPSLLGNEGRWITALHLYCTDLVALDPNAKSLGRYSCSTDGPCAWLNKQLLSSFIWHSNTRFFFFHGHYLFREAICRGQSSRKTVGFNEQIMPAGADTIRAKRTN